MEFNADDAMRIARWFIVTRPKMKRAAMFVGGVDEVVNEAMLRLCKNSNGLKKYQLSSCVVRNVMWSIANMTRTKMRQDRALRSTAIARNMLVDGEQEQYAASREVSELVMREVSRLGDREYAIITARMTGETLDEVGCTHRITKERVRQIEGKAIRKMTPNLKYLELDIR